jgi:hypothetical protein
VKTRFDIVNAQLGKFKKLDVRNRWKKETDFTPWLAQEENITLLSKALGFELEVVKVEAAVGPYSADILAKDTVNDSYVIIENQLGKTNHDHLGKAITYGSVLHASAIVWIASNFTEEHQRALDWLNEFTTDELSFYGIQVELWQIDNSLPAVRFDVISRPAFIKKKDAGGDSEELTEVRKLQLDFWTVFRDNLIEKNVISSAQKPRPQYWFDIPLGKSNIFLSCTANSFDGKIGVRVYIGSKIADTALPYLEEQKDEIENELSMTLDWNPNKDARDKIIAVYHDADLFNRAKWNEYISWLVDTAGRFRKVFMPRVKKLKK